MTRSTFDGDAFRDDDDRMTPYYVDDGTPTEGSFPFDERIHAAGGMVSSVIELSTYLISYINDGSVDGADLLDPESLDPDDRRFAVVTEAGKRTPATFEAADDGYDLFFERWRLHGTD